MAQGKYFFIKSHLHGLVLDVEGGRTGPGTALVTWSQKHDHNDNQLFYEDHATGTIRSRLNHYCVDAQGGHVVLNPHSPHSPHQQWLVNGFRIQNRHHHQRVMDIANSDPNPGAKVCVWDYNGGANQHWNLEYTRPPFFFIRSDLNNKVMDISGANRSPHAKVVMWLQKGQIEDNQLWYEDRAGIIRSKLNHFALDVERGRIVMMPHEPHKQSQAWVVSGNHIVNRFNHNELLDIIAANKSDGAEICPYKAHGGANQRWKIVYI